MTKTLTKTLLVLALFCGFAWAQSAPTYTTLAAAVTGGGNTPGSGLGNQPIQTTLLLASVTNINGFGAGVSGPQGFNPNGAIQYNTYLLIDRELFAVQTVNTTAKTVTVLRGWQGTVVTPHNSGAVVIAAFPAQFSVIDPVGACLGSGTLVSPVITIAGSAPPVGNFGRQWICDATTGDWLPVLSTGTITPVATAAAIGVAVQTFTLNGTVTGEPIAVMVEPTQTALCPLVQARITATNTVSLGFAVMTAAACTPASGVYYFFDPLHY